MAETLWQLLHSELIIQKHTIAPHIEAVNRMLDGDRALLEIMFDSDEFDILAAGPMSFITLPQDHKLLVGYDDIRVIHVFDALLYMHTDDSNRLNLRSFVSQKLKSKYAYLGLAPEEQHEILKSYRDLLYALEHEGKRLTAFSLHVVVPALQRFVRSKKFMLFSTKPIFYTLECISALCLEHKDFIPSTEFFEETRHGGIQRAL